MTLSFETTNLDYPIMFADEADARSVLIFEVKWKHKVHELPKAVNNIPVFHRILLNSSTRFG
jgi:hypothetical protein